ncbi:MAG: CoA-transferase subunit beta [Solirubrobacterales bacterium]|nr:CoA-transferase subunit beta [Solirubrobacterales bacterium]
MSDYELDELVVAALAREFPDDTVAFNGAVSFVPVCALMLARATHSPNLVWVAGSIAVDPQPTEIPESTLVSTLWDGATMLQSSVADFWAYAQSGRLNSFCFRGAQMDAHGNVNNTVIGAYDEPKIRLPGGGGMADLGCLVPRIYLWSTTHDTRTFVERLDFRSGLGWGDGGDHRERLGLSGGPVACVTNLAVLDFHPESRRMRLRSVHPGVSVEDVVAATGFELVIEGDVPETPAPSAEEVQLIRTLDPTGARRREFAAAR